MIRALLLAGVLAAWGAGGQAAGCTDVVDRGIAYTVCEVRADQEDLRLFLRDPDGEILGHFGRIDGLLAGQGLKLGFAMNAGMYHRDRDPVGHYVENGVEQMRVIPNAGPGNFGLLPNGVFCIRSDRADVIETLEYVRTAPGCRFATQSGPMLVIGGELHPALLPEGTSRFIRNGVGTSADGTRAVFAISRDPVNFYDFANLFRDHLGLPNALYLDGNVSRLYAPDLNRHDGGFQLGPIVGTVVPLDG